MGNPLLPAITVGRHCIDVPVLLAPMSGVTDKPYRTAVQRMGGGVTVSEMISGGEAVRKTKGTLSRFEKTGFDFPTPVQLAGHDPDVLADAARMAVDLGADIIDINFGCPAKKVVGKLCGSALMRDESHAGKIMESVVAAVDVPVTIKMRLGWDEAHKNAPLFARIAESAGVQMVTVHGRTREQKYLGNADWSYIAKVSDAVSIPVIANGDITSLSHIDRCLAQSKADGIMIGRGSYGRPWFVGQALAYVAGRDIPDTPTLLEQRDTVLQHYQDILRHYGDYAGLRIGRKHLGWYLKSASDGIVGGIRNASAVRDVIVALEDKNAVIEQVMQFYENAHAVYGGATAPTYNVPEHTAPTPHPHHRMGGL